MCSLIINLSKTSDIAASIFIQVLLLSNIQTHKSHKKFSTGFAEDNTSKIQINQDFVTTNVFFSPRCAFSLLRYHKSDFYASNLTKIIPLGV